MNDQAENVEKDKSDKSNVEKDKSKFNWVAEHSACSIPKVFKELRLQVEEDVKTRNGLRPKNSPYELSVTENGYDFSVLLQAAAGRRSVTFSAAEHAILVLDDSGKQMLEITLTFNDQGKCILHVNQQEQELWQVRRLALEGLFFQNL